MCGIVFALKRNDGRARKRVLKLYQEQKARGQEGYGYVAISKDGTVLGVNRTQHEHQIQRLLNGEGDLGSCLFHHRNPTSTPNIKEEAHPITVSNEKLTYDYHVVHNGMISNADEIKKTHDTQGYAYTTLIETYYKVGNTTYPVEEMFNDTEAFAVDVAQMLDGKKAFLEARGSVAFIALQVEKTTKKVINMFYGRNVNPLYECSDNMWTISSENANPKATMIKAHMLYKLDFATKDITETHLVIPGYGTYKEDADYATGWEDYKSPYGYWANGEWISTTPVDDTDDAEKSEMDEKPTTLHLPSPSIPSLGRLKRNRRRDTESIGEFLDRKYPHVGFREVKDVKREVPVIDASDPTEDDDCVYGADNPTEITDEQKDDAERIEKIERTLDELDELEPTLNKMYDIEAAVEELEEDLLNEAVKLEKAQKDKDSVGEARIMFEIAKIEAELGACKKDLEQIGTYGYTEKHGKPKEPIAV